MKFSISQLQDFVRCPQLAHVRHIQLRDRAGGSPALTLGTMFHLAMEDKLLARPSRPSTSLWMEVENGRDGAIELWEKHQLGAVIDGWHRPEEYGVPEGVEEVLEFPLGGHTVQCKLDSNVLRNGFRWSEQHKTYADDLQALTEKVRLSWHEIAYETALKHNYGSAVGTILNACQKLPGYKLMDLDGSGKKKRVDVTLEMRLAALTTHYLTRNEGEIRQGLWSIEAYADKMEEWFLTFPIVRNNSACFDMNGHRCPIFAHCWEGEELVEPMFVQLKDRYAATV